ncbi:MAG: lysylphosphatidylglycerol synthase transmembrane domain-containing protein [Streptosporangiaceae bacterium]
MGSSQSLLEPVRAGLAPLRKVTAGTSIPQILLGLAVAVAVIVLGFLNWDSVSDGLNSLVEADGDWVLLAVVFTAIVMMIGTITQLGSMPVTPPIGRVFAVQIAATFANHLLPANSGGMAINIRFLQKYGVSKSAAVGAVGLNSLAGFVTHTLLLLVAVVAAPSTISAVKDLEMWPDWGSIGTSLVNSAWAMAALGVLVLLLLVFTAFQLRPGGWGSQISARTGRLCRRMVKELRGLGSVLRHPGRALALWLGSLSTPLLHAAVLFAVLRSIGALIALGTVVVIYVVMSSVASFLPSPGGVGGLDVALVGGLYVVGVPNTTAVAAVLGYRLLTVWLPLLPGAVVFAVLLRRRII